MSATLENMAHIASWFDAVSYVTEFRPVPLREYVYIDKTVSDARGDYVRNIRDDKKYILVEEVVIEKKQQCLIFCSSKRHCEIFATEWCKHVEYLEKAKKDIPNINKYKVGRLIEKLRRIYGNSLDSRMCKMLLYGGIAFHHAGLLVRVRKPE
jgi:replicative superfamily II helicase